MIGCRARDSLARKAASSAAAITNAPTAMRLPHPCEAAWMKPYTSRVIPAVEVSAPTRSNRPGWRSDSGRNSGAVRATTMPMGTLMNSTQRHDTHSVITPPSTRPSEPPPMATAV